MTDTPQPALCDEKGVLCECASQTHGYRRQPRPLYGLPMRRMRRTCTRLCPLGAEAATAPLAVAKALLAAKEADE